MKRNIWNMIIDTLSFIVFMCMISTGLLLKFILPPGSGRVAMMAKAGRGHKSIDLFMGLARHEWGQIHFYISLAFLLLLVIHLYLHWNWIMAMTLGTKQKPQPFKRRLASTGIVLITLLILVFPWLVPKQSLTKQQFQEIRNISVESKAR